MKRIAATLAGIGLLIAGCGHHDKAPGGGGGGNSYQKSLAFAKCMRSHGDPSFPDPGPEGAFPNVNGSLKKDSPQFKKAAAACKNLEPGGPAPSDFQRDYRQLLKYSACMRSHGMPKFPDPTLEDHGVGWTGPKIDDGSPQFKSANQACRSYLPSGNGPE
jgi:hypothetical protein